MSSTFEECLLQLTSSSRHVVFAPACYRHGLSEEAAFDTLAVDGITAQGQLEAFVIASERKNAVSGCLGVNCEETCPGKQDWGAV
jgi:hypothetical protein